MQKAVISIQHKTAAELAKVQTAADTFWSRAEQKRKKNREITVSVVTDAQKG